MCTGLRCILLHYTNIFSTEVKEIAQIFFEKNN